MSQNVLSKISILLHYLFGGWTWCFLCCLFPPKVCIFYTLGTWNIRFLMLIQLKKFVNVKVAQKSRISASSYKHDDRYMYPYSWTLKEFRLSRVSMISTLTKLMHPRRLWQSTSCVIHLSGFSVSFTSPKFVELFYQLLVDAMMELKTSKCQNKSEWIIGVLHSSAHLAAKYLTKTLPFF